WRGAAYPGCSRTQPSRNDARSAGGQGNRLAAVVEWRISDRPVGYEEAVQEMDRRAAAIAAGRAPELAWLLEHPPLYTAGTSTRFEDLKDAGMFPVHRTGRGGQLTYHGP